MSLWAYTIDANKFNPDRFLKMDESKLSNVGVFGIVLTFSGRPCGCIGWQFAQALFVNIFGQSFFYRELPP
ncbi:hypothetical protein EI94DRAFT_179809 [Lactarius quietus]|nr:hypothetical protein EI94DRAFT_179809 [Lactarius quietus]